MYHPPAASSSTPHYDPYGSRRLPPPSGQGASTPSSGASGEYNLSRINIESDFLLGIQFKHSPFFKIERAISNVVECPGTSYSCHHKIMYFTKYVLLRIDESNGSSLADTHLHDEQRSDNKAQFNKVLSSYYCERLWAHEIIDI